MWRESPTKGNAAQAPHVLGPAQRRSSVTNDEGYDLAYQYTVRFIRGISRGYSFKSTARTASGRVPGRTSRTG
jgi:hypothetical protein